MKLDGTGMQVSVVEGSREAIVGVEGRHRWTVLVELPTGTKMRVNETRLKPDR